MTRQLVSLLVGAYGQVGSGRIQGGWSYVWVSYGLTWGTLALYSLSLWLRRLSLKQQAQNP